MRARRSHAFLQVEGLPHAGHVYSRSNHLPLYTSGCQCQVITNSNPSTGATTYLREQRPSLHLLISRLLQVAGSGTAAPSTVGAQQQHQAACGERRAKSSPASCVHFARPLAPAEAACPIAAGQPCGAASTCA
eukprot:1159892-Pelagomonas_calceolata.AAC.23